MGTMSSPSTMTLPRSGLSRPIMCFISTVLPEPEPPRMTQVVPSSMSRLMPVSTWLSPKDFHRSWTEIIGGCRVVGAHRGTGAP